MYAELCSYLHAAAQNTDSLQEKSKGLYVYSQQRNLHSKQSNMNESCHERYMCHDSFACAQVVRTYERDRSHKRYVWRVSFKSRTRPATHMNESCHERYMWHDSFVCAQVKWMRDTSHIWMRVFWALTRNVTLIKETSHERCMCRDSFVCAQVFHTYEERGTYERFFWTLRRPVTH